METLLPLHSKKTRILQSLDDMPGCAAFGCHNSFKNTQGVRFHRFPKNHVLSRAWVAALSREDKFNVSSQNPSLEE